MVSRFIPTPGEGKNDGPARDAAKASGFSRRAYQLWSVCNEARTIWP
jgi:hypothetical protein